MRLAAFAILSLAILAAPAARADLESDIEAQPAAVRTAFLSGDAAKVAALYTKEAQVIAPGSPIAAGREAIAAFWKGAMAGVKDVNLATTKVEGDDDLAVEDGVVTLTAPDGSTSTARYLVVWKHEDGKWKLHRDIWNATK
jgi:uncharacterized protein (TIGR02246 family)